MNEEIIAAMEQALEALELSNANHWWGSSSIEAAITALRQALEQQPVEKEIQRLRALVRAQQITIEKLEQQPADDWEHLKQYGYAPSNYMMTCRECDKKVIDVDKRASRCRTCAETMYAKRQQPAAIQQGWDVDTLLSKPKQQPAAPQRSEDSKQWIGLTDEDLEDIAIAARKGNLHDLRIVVEAKLREKNVGAA